MTKALTNGLLACALAALAGCNKPPASQDTQIAATDAIIVRYRMWSWKTGALLTDKFTDPDTGNLSDTIQCWKDGLVNQPLGSRIMLVCPPATGFPNGNPTPSIAAGDTVVFVVDLMFAAPNS